MKQSDYRKLERYMIGCLADQAHDSEHIYRVLYAALDIAATEENVDMDVLIAACLLHDVARGEQSVDPTLCHAAEGAKKARKFLAENQFPPAFTEHVADSIRTHRFRAGDPPASIEAKILFDADKLDVAGAFGLARSILYAGIYGEPIYLTLPDGSISDGKGDMEDSLFREYWFKLVNLYTGFQTKRGAELAAERRHAAEAFYNAMYQEVSAPRINGIRLLSDQLTPDE